MRLQFLFLLLLFSAGYGFSQSEFNYEVYRPSINSAQFNIGASIETALSKGQPSPSLYLNFKVKAITFPCRWYSMAGM